MSSVSVSEYVRYCNQYNRLYHKNLLYNHKLSIGIVICPILSDTIACVSKKFAYTYNGFISCEKELLCLKK
jgi:hypothetical protein